MRKLFYLVLFAVFSCLAAITVLNITYVDRIVVPGFPIQPSSVFLQKTVNPGCMNHTTGQPNCIETKFTWKSEQQVQSVVNWYKSQRTNPLWACADSTRVPGPTEINVQYLNCVFDKTTYELVFQPHRSTTYFTLIVNSSM